MLAPSLEILTKSVRVLPYVGVSRDVLFLAFPWEAWWFLLRLDLEGASGGEQASITHNIICC